MGMEDEFAEQEERGGEQEDSPEMEERRSLPEPRKTRPKQRILILQQRFEKELAQVLKRYQHPENIPDDDGVWGSLRKWLEELGKLTNEDRRNNESLWLPRVMDEGTAAKKVVQEIKQLCQRGELSTVNAISKEAEGLLRKFINPSTKELKEATLKEFKKAEKLSAMYLGQPLPPQEKAKVDLQHSNGFEKLWFYLVVRGQEHIKNSPRYRPLLDYSDVVNAADDIRITIQILHNCGSVVKDEDIVKWAERMLLWGDEEKKIPSMLERIYRKKKNRRVIERPLESLVSRDTEDNKQTVDNTAEGIPDTQSKIITKVIAANEIKRHDDELEKRIGKLDKQHAKRRMLKALRLFLRWTLCYSSDHGNNEREKSFFNGLIEQMDGLDPDSEFREKKLDEAITDLPPIDELLAKANLQGFDVRLYRKHEKDKQFVLRPDASEFLQDILQSSSRFRAGDLKNLFSLIVELLNPQNPLSQYLHQKRFSPDTRKLLDKCDKMMWKMMWNLAVAKSHFFNFLELKILKTTLNLYNSIPPDDVLKKALVNELNQLIQGNCRHNCRAIRSLLEENYPEGVRTRKNEQNAVSQELTRVIPILDNIQKLVDSDLFSIKEKAAELRMRRVILDE